MIESKATYSTEDEVLAPFSLPLGFLEAKPSASRTTNDSCLGIGRIVVFGGPWVSKEMLEVALLPTVRAEALPLLAPPILLGVVLPELGSLGGGENMFTNWLLVGGGDIRNCASTNEHFLSK
jgi:hypothetical protein